MLSEELKSLDTTENPRACKNYSIKKEANAFSMRAMANKLMALKDGGVHDMSQADEFSESAIDLLVKAQNICDHARCQIKEQCIACISEDLNPLHRELVAKTNAISSRMSIDTVAALAQIALQDRLERPRGGITNWLLGLIGKRSTSSI